MQNKVRRVEPGLTLNKLSESFALSGGVFAALIFPIVGYACAGTTVHAHHDCEDWHGRLAIGLAQVFFYIYIFAYYLTLVRSEKKNIQKRIAVFMIVVQVLGLVVFGVNIWLMTGTSCTGGYDSMAMTASVFVLLGVLGTCIGAGVIMLMKGRTSVDNRVAQSNESTQRPLKQADQLQDEGEGEDQGQDDME